MVVIERLWWGRGLWVKHAQWASDIVGIGDGPHMVPKACVQETKDQSRPFVGVADRIDLVIWVKKFDFKSGFGVSDVDLADGTLHPEGR